MLCNAHRNGRFNSVRHSLGFLLESGLIGYRSHKSFASSNP